MTGSSDRPDVAKWPGYAVPPGVYAAAPIRRIRVSRLLLTWVLGVGVVAAALVGFSAHAAAPAAVYVCPPDCGRPPTGEPVTINPRFTPPDGSFSVSYPVPGSSYAVSTDDTGVRAEFVGGDGGTMHLFSEPARGRTPQQIIEDLLGEAAPDAITDYEIPNAMVGYQPGFGVAADDWPQSATASYQRTRILVMAAVKNDLALVAAAVGPYRQFGPDSGSGKPSGANLQLALDLGKYVNSFRWAGDPPR